MHPIKQILRQKGKTLVGIALVAMAVAILGVCVGQALMAGQTGRQLEYNFTTVALETSFYDYRLSGSGQKLSSNTMLPAMQEYIDQQMQAHPELVETVAHTSLSSAYIPSLVQDNYLQHDYLEYFEHMRSEGIQGRLPRNTSQRYATNYSGAMFVVTVNSMSDVRENWFEEKTDKGGKVNVLQSITLTLQTTIDEVISLEAGFDDPTGWPLELEVRAYSQEELSAMDLKVGGQYLVYGVDYLDLSYKIMWQVQALSEYSHDIPFREYDRKLLHFLTEKDKEDFLIGNPDLKSAPYAIYGSLNVIYEGVPRVPHPDRDGTYLLSPQDCVILWDDSAFYQYQTARMTVQSQAYRDQLDKATGQLSQTREVEENGETVTISREEYMQRYGLPTIRPIKTTAQDLLQEDPLFANQLDYNEISIHGFAVLGVEKLGYVANFAQETCRITQGRDFTQQEMETGAAVCVISEQLALLNGLQVGDAVPMQFYTQDTNLPYQSSILKGRGTVCPTACFYSATGQLQEEKTYTIVGLYRQDDAWEDVEGNNYAFTPNTIFVPQSSHNSSKLFSSQGVFRTIVLKNGAMEAFDALMQDHGFTAMTDPYAQEGVGKKLDVFVYYDQGYSDVRDSFANYQEMGNRVLLVGIVMYSVIFLLFLMLYPGSLTKRLRTMATMGAPRKDKILHVVYSSLGVLLPGTVLGGLFTVVLWGPVVSKLLATGGAVFGLGINVMTLLLISLLQLAVATGLVFLLALPMTKHKNLMKHK